MGSVISDVANMCVCFRLQPGTEFWDAPTTIASLDRSKYFQMGRTESTEEDGDGSEEGEQKWYWPLCGWELYYSGSVKVFFVLSCCVLCERRERGMEREKRGERETERETERGTEREHLKLSLI